MSDLGVAAVAGGLTILASATTGALAFVGTNWLQIRQAKRATTQQEREIEARRSSADRDALRSEHREQLKPLFNLLDEMEQDFT